ncbi:MAG: hypothetical protein ACREEV_08015 [Dongiaceae bacterium]
MGKLLPAIAGALVVGAVSLLGSPKKKAAPARSRSAKKVAPRPRRPARSKRKTAGSHA